MAEKGSEVMKIDVGQVLRERLGKRYGYVPTGVVSWLRRLVHEDELNHILECNAGKEGVDFSRGALDNLGVTYRVVGSFPRQKRVVVVSNHPLGGLDGMAMSCAVADAYGKEGLKFVVNDLLQAIVPLRTIFLPVNKLGSQSREAIQAVDEAFDGPYPIIMFPAGLVSRKIRGRIMDLEWHKMVVQKAIASRRDVVPVWFSGRNTDFFYNFALWRKRLGLKFNIEMALLPSEVFKSRGKNYDIIVGNPVAWKQLRGGLQARQQAAELRERVYQLSHLYNQP